MTGYRKTDRRMPPRACPISESENVVIARMWKSPRDRKNTIVISIKEYEGHRFLDCRVFGTNAEGQSIPSTKGVTVGMASLPQFHKAISAALVKAREMGLVKDDATS
ncbi:MAG: hypothetical protein H0V72_22935 [Bradyrhizobium sp.]|nr:hypothetical protein [Bradyrhizobium sp.]